MAARPARSYVICTGPRTGSTLLAYALVATGIAGRPHEYFDLQDHVDAYWRQELRVGPHDDYFDKVVEAGTTGNGIFGFKLHWPQIDALRAALRIPTADATEVARALDARLGDLRYIWLRRRDKVAQGISYSRAALTEQWRLEPGETPSPVPPFDFAHVDWHIALAREFDERWRQFFEAARGPVLTLTYEGLAGNYEPTIRCVLDYLGLASNNVPIALPALRRQADAASSLWDVTYRTMKG